MNKLTKIILTFLLLVTVAMGYSTVAMADSKSEKQLITEMVQEIEDLGATPIKKGLKSRKKYISVLKEQLEELQKQKKKQALMDDLRKQILELNPDAKPVEPACYCDSQTLLIDPPRENPQSPLPCRHKYLSL